jgi:agmatine/peptidylarginine deiminase
MEVHDEIREILQHEVDAKGRRFEVHIIDEPDPTCLPSTYEDPATNYVNFYFVNGGLIVPQFGDPPRDQAALATLQTLCPDREVRQLQVRALPLAGGVIHCATQPVIAVKDN